ncbi:MAG: hypothetical protein V1914_01310 [archaeon]
MNETTTISIGGNKQNKIKGCYALITNGTVTCFKDDKYRVPRYCLGILKKKGVEFREISK